MMFLFLLLILIFSLKVDQYSIAFLKNTEVFNKGVCQSISKELPQNLNHFSANR